MEIDIMTTEDKFYGRMKEIPYDYLDIIGFRNKPYRVFNFVNNDTTKFWIVIEEEVNGI